jgi:hypothetical protein
LFSQLGQGFGQLALGLGLEVDLALRGDQGIFEFTQARHLADRRLLGGVPAWPGG